ncbi:MAG TPA: ImmA/IrrE family metallo-endopeptidase, partial [Thermoanaerobaculia bacterium]|nr:ImmA/IrrE family metallo-endopeptidase [Thermoanaerobaculia bacterium]
MPVKVDALLAWEDEASDKRPTVKQLRKLANIYKRPLAVFYLSEPPKSFQAMHDYRRLPGDWMQQESPDLRLEIRRARYRREVALALYAALGDEPPRFDLATSLDTEAEETATSIRRVLGITWDQQTSWRQPYPALHAWRGAAESVGILVFQMSGVEVEEARGFSIGEHPLPVIAVNAKDAPRARIFSMLHEIAHLTL